MAGSAIVRPDFSLPEAVWRAHELAARDEAVLPSGLPALDAVLPGGGWPVGALVELLQAVPHQQVWRLLAPVLARALAAQAGPVLLVAPPHPVFAPALAAQGLPAGRLLWVRAEAPSARLWAAEQALRCTEVAAVLAWLPQARPADLRRLHLAAQPRRRLLFVMRPQAAAAQASPARLRLRVAGGAGASDSLQLDVLKRRGPPLAAPVCLPPWHGLLGQLLRARAGDPLPGRSHGLDRAAAFA
ncbi:translesion DNA synthesis-associated protein ImuA [Ramlibacter sp. MAHUQ-53]|uniref:translesion DNA synthesis-associated protein ImuA n=1 Tax=unclassified Ramlibacter TaxID=2617605 RepID=UPI00363CC248